MSTLTVTRWTRYGKDRLYVRTAEGADIGHVDLQRHTTYLVDPSYESQFVAIARQWIGNFEPEVGEKTQPHAPVGAVLSSPELTHLPPPKPLDPGVERAHDLAANLPGAAARAKRDEVNRGAPVLNLLARAVGEKTAERNWRIGYKAEERVGKALGSLPDGWHVLHAIPVGDRGSDIDHLVVGPCGVFSLNTKCRPDGDVWVGQHAVKVNRHSTDYLRNSRFEARRASETLTRACGWDVQVVPVVVFVGIAKFTVR